MSDWEPLNVDPDDREEGIHALRQAPVLKVYLLGDHDACLASLILGKKPGGGLDSLHPILTPAPMKEWVGHPWHAINHDLSQAGTRARYARVLSGLHLYVGPGRAEAPEGDRPGGGGKEGQEALRNPERPSEESGACPPGVPSDNPVGP